MKPNQVFLRQTHAVYHLGFLFHLRSKNVWKLQKSIKNASNGKFRRWKDKLHWPWSLVVAAPTWAESFWDLKPARQQGGFVNKNQASSNFRLLDLPPLFSKKTSPKLFPKPFALNERRLCPSSDSVFKQLLDQRHVTSRAASGGRSCLTCEEQRERSQGSQGLC